MRDWKTTVSAFITAAAGFVMFSPELFANWPILLALSKYITVGGLLSLGIASADVVKKA